MSLNTVKIEQPKRVTHSYQQTINGTIEDIFPLYCPVKELLWTESWNPKVVYSKSGLVEPDCVFISQEGEQEATWFVTVYDTEQGCVEMIKHVPGITMTKLVILVEPLNNQKTRAIITYSATSLSSLGDTLLKKLTKEAFDISMNAWEQAMNHYLQTGQMLKGLPAF
ncbi:MAG TPA: hypothetical protein DCS93_24795 [Microscillaceae bacterium]|nr:hypothetical protein [Microscillaceae bacterium]